MSVSSMESPPRAYAGSPESYKGPAIAATHLGELAKMSSMGSLGSYSIEYDDLVSEPGPEYIRHNLKSYNQRLLEYLLQQGLNANPLRLQVQKPASKGLLKFGSRSQAHSPNLDVFLTANGQILFLPFNPWRRKRHRVREAGEDTTMRPEDYAEEEDEEGDDEETGSSFEDQAGQHMPHTRGTAPKHRAVTGHTFCGIVRLSKEETLTPIVKANYHTDARTRWVQGIPTARGKSFKEKYRVSKDLNWDLDMRHPDCFIPFKNYDDASDELSFDAVDESEDSSVTTGSKSGEPVYSATPTQPVQTYELLDPKSYVNEIDNNGKDTDPSRNLFLNDQASVLGAVTFPPGYYVFLMPVAYPINTPETVITPLGSVTHVFDMQIEKQPYNPSIPAPSAAASSPMHHSKFNDSASYSNSNLSSPSSPGGSFSLSHLSASPPTHRGGSVSVGGIKASIFKKMSLHRTPSHAKSVSGIERTGSMAGSLLSGIKSRATGGGSDNGKTLEAFNYELPVIRLPPSDATSTLNKSIYVNKVWNNALNYELLLPRKYVQLSPLENIDDQYLQPRQFMLQMKLIPLVKGLCLKRIKINVVEKATYISKDQKYEEDVGKVDRSGIKERVVTLLEINARDRPSHNDFPPLCSQVVKGCVDDNLLTCCYKDSEFDHDVDPSQDSLKEDVIITNPVKIQCPLTFTANDETGFIESVHKNLTKGAVDLADLRDSAEDVADSGSIFSATDAQSETREHENAAVEEYETSDSWTANVPELSRKLTRTKTLRKFTTSNESLSDLSDPEKIRIYTFAPDTTFHNVKVRHRLQICFRVSRPDRYLMTPEGPKMHHYEVIVDTPIIFVSPFCVSEALELPSYDYAVKSSTFGQGSVASGFNFAKDEGEEDTKTHAKLPTFEEAILQPGSPMMTGMTGIPTYDAVSRTFNSTSPTSFSESSLPRGSLTSADDFSSLDSVVEDVPVPTVGDELFAKRTVRKRSTIGSQLSAAAAHSKPKSYASIDSTLHNPSRSSLDYESEELPSYQAVIEQDMSEGLEEGMSLLGVDDNNESNNKNNSMRNNSRESVDTVQAESSAMGARTNQSDSISPNDSREFQKERSPEPKHIL